MNASTAEPGAKAFSLTDVSYHPPHSDTLLVKGIQTSITHATLTTVVGPNGAGKSTLLRLLCGLLAPTEGRIDLDGSPLSNRSRAERARQIAYVPQSLPTRFHFTVQELVSTGRHPRRGRLDARSEADRSAVDAALESCGLVPFRDRLLTSLSGGELQRTLIARCLAAEAPVLILDEPTASLDVDHTLEVLGLCRLLAEEGRTVIVSLHDLDQAARVADASLVLDRGRLAASGPPERALRDEIIETVFGVHPQWFEGETGERVLHLTKPDPSPVQ